MIIQYYSSCWMLIQLQACPHLLTCLDWFLWQIISKSHSSGHDTVEWQHSGSTPSACRAPQILLCSHRVHSIRQFIYHNRYLSTTKQQCRCGSLKLRLWIAFRISQAPHKLSSPLCQNYSASILLWNDVAPWCFFHFGQHGEDHSSY